MLNYQCNGFIAAAQMKSWPKGQHMGFPASGVNGICLFGIVYICISAHCGPALQCLVLLPYTTITLGFLAALFMIFRIRLSRKWCCALLLPANRCCPPF